MLGVFFTYMEEYRHNDYFFKTANLYNMYKVKLQKMYVTHIYTYVCFEIFFFNVFIIHFLKILRSVLRKIAIDPLYLWDVSDIIYEKKFLPKIWFIHAEQMYLYNFIILRKKRLQHRCFPLKFVKLKLVASQNT